MLYYNKQTQERISERQLQESGLLGHEEKLGIVPLVKEHGYDTSLYYVQDSGRVNAGDKTAEVVWDVMRKTDADTGEQKQHMHASVNRKRDVLLQGGMSFSYQSESHTLQTRGVEDIINWVGLQIKASQLPQDTALTLRTKENVTISIPAGKVVLLIDAAVALREQIMAASWELKDSIAAAKNLEKAYEIYEAGIDSVWPDNGPILIQEGE